MKSLVLGVSLFTCLFSVFVACAQVQEAVTEPAAEMDPLPPLNQEPGFEPLFDGKTLNGWKAADMSFWSVEDGAITAK
ncbi:MAG: hypothetical protein U9Q79_05015, partial [Candidatus Hydrogenedentes bacterium]|nr:hypothetical protein [Candidatus Hydrogenedentota bacterium]